MLRAAEPTKDAITKVLVDAVRNGVFTTVGIVAFLTSASFENDIVFAVGIAAAFALASLRSLQKLFHRQPQVVFHFLGSFIGGIMPAVSFAFIATKVAVIVAAGFSMFLTFIANAAAMEKKTFKDGAKASLLVLLQVVLCYLVGKILLVII